MLLPDAHNTSSCLFQATQATLEFGQVIELLPCFYQPFFGRRFNLVQNSFPHFWYKPLMVTIKKNHIHIITANDLDGGTASPSFKTVEKRSLLPNLCACLLKCEANISKVRLNLIKFY
jgi:hypothetical protein